MYITTHKYFVLVEKLQTSINYKTQSRLGPRKKINVELQGGWILTQHIKRTAQRFQTSSTFKMRKEITLQRFITHINNLLFLTGLEFKLKISKNTNWIKIIHVYTKYGKITL